MIKKLIAKYSGLETDKLNINGEREALCIVTQLQNYEDLYLKCSLQQIGAIMNQYYEIIADAIMKNGGSIDRFCDKYTISIFSPCERSAFVGDNALIAAIAIMQTLRGLSKKEVCENLDVGIGICSGSIYYGVFGSQERAAATGFGVPINCAFKLSTMTSPINICEHVIASISAELLSNIDVKVWPHNGP